jgi:hypothetical protein
MRAIRWDELAVAYDKHEGELVWLAQDPRLDKIRRDQHYKRLLARIVGGVGT